jgi:hypothetical protein
MRALAEWVPSWHTRRTSASTGLFSGESVRVGAGQDDAGECIKAVPGASCVLTPGHDRKVVVYSFVSARCAPLEVAFSGLWSLLRLLGIPNARSIHLVLSVSTEGPGRQGNRSHSNGPTSALLHMRGVSVACSRPRPSPPCFLGLFPSRTSLAGQLQVKDTIRTISLSKLVRAN